MPTKTIKTKKLAAISFPLAGLRPLYSSQKGKKLAIEVDIKSMKRVNNPNTIDEMVAEARLDYAMGRTKGFTDTKEMMRYLEA